MQSLRMELLLRKHTAERLTMDVRHALAWLEFYTHVEQDMIRAKQWSDTLQYRIKLMNQADEAYAEFARVVAEPTQTCTEDSSTA